MNGWIQVSTLPPRPEHKLRGNVGTPPPSVDQRRIASAGEDPVERLGARGHGSIHAAGSGGTAAVVQEAGRPAGRLTGGAPGPSRVETDSRHPRCFGDSLASTVFSHIRQRRRLKL